jgi:CubicO group peptidase (beta-lactamase class C family)
MSRAIRFSVLLLLGLLQFISHAAPTEIVAGMDAARLKQVRSRLQRFVDEQLVSGAVTLVARRGRVVSLEAVGYSDLAARRPMRPDHLFWIASMTKPITATAVLMLQDEGRLSVDDPVEKFLPEFKGQWLVQSRGSNSLTLTRPARPITLRDLLTHTSGIGEVPSPRPDTTLAELVMGFSQQPLQFPPGSRWSYSNAGINTLGRVVEVVSGSKFEDFLEKRILRPLEMKDTTFWPNAAQVKRLAKSYQPDKGGSGLEEVGIRFIKGELSDRTRTPSPAGGLFSTAEDMARFYQMLLSGGEWHGRRLLSKDTIAQMTRTQTGDLKTGFTEGMSFGLGFAVVKEPSGVTAMLSRGTFGHGGAYGTQSWADPEKDLVLVLMIQHAKLPNADASDMRHTFQQAAVAAVVD